MYIYSRSRTTLSGNQSTSKDDTHFGSIRDGKCSAVTDCMHPPSAWVNFDLASSARLACSLGRRNTLGTLSMAAMDMTSLEQLQATHQGPIRRL